MDTIVFDKTGTLTSGTPRVSRIITIEPDTTPERILQFAASCQEKQILVGSHHFMEDFNVDHEAGHAEDIRIQKNGEGVLFVARDGKLIGLIGVEDKIRKEAVTTLNRLKRRGVKNIFMLTGDNEFNAKAIGDRLPLTEIGWSMLPEDKAEFIKKFKDDHSESVVAMVGDGINDTPAFSSADLSFVMGSTLVIPSPFLELMSPSGERNGDR